MLLSAVLATLVATAAAKDKRTFAVLRFKGNGPLTEGRSDPIVSFGGPSSHVHTVMGGSGFGNSATTQSLLNSKCSNANIKGDLSAYWMPKLYFHDKATNTFEPVQLFYMNVYYFFEATNDKIKAFPKGLQMLSGSPTQRTPPSTGGRQILDPADGPVQPAQFTCPRSNTNIPAWPVNSDGTKGGFQDPGNKGSGVGFPFAECDGYASPLRADLHFPSCYDPSKGLGDYRNNMVWPRDAGGGKHDCPPGFIHTPHIFFEMYWNTPKFNTRWTPNQGYQPFVLSNGDAAGYSLHGDFFSAWDENLLQHIIDTCDAGSRGMDNCPGVTLNDAAENCHIENPTPEAITGKLTSLPGKNPLFGWQYGTGGGAPPSGGNGGAAPSGGNGGATPTGGAPGGGNGGGGGYDGGSGGGSAPGGGSSPGGGNPPTDQYPPPANTPPPAAGSPPESGPGYEQGPPPESTFPAQAPPYEAPAPTGYPVGGGSGVVTPSVSVSTDAAGQTHLTTVWHTVTVYQTATVYDDGPEPTGIPPTSNKADASGWKYAGCYRDTRDRVIQGEKFPKLGPLTNDKCAAYCQAKGFCVSGTENSGQCFCGDAVVGSEKLDDSACSKPCDGDATESCGGGWALSVYSKDGSIGAPDAKRDLHAHILRHRSRRGAPGRRV